MFDDQLRHPPYSDSARELTVKKIIIFASLLGALTVSGAAFSGDSTSLGDSSAVTLNIPTATEGQSCSYAGATAFDTNKASMVCIGNVWRRNIIWNSGTVSSGSSCTGMPRGSLAFDNNSKLYVCK